MKCCGCGEDLIGDGYTTALHCPYISEEQKLSLDCREPDADPLYCDLK